MKKVLIAALLFSQVSYSTLSASIPRSYKLRAAIMKMGQEEMKLSADGVKTADVSYVKFQKKYTQIAVRISDRLCILKLNNLPKGRWNFDNEMACSDIIGSDKDRFASGQTFFSAIYKAAQEHKFINSVIAVKNSAVQVRE